MKEEVMIVQKKEVMCGDEKAIQYVIENKDGFVIWSTLAKDKAYKKHVN